MIAKLLSLSGKIESSEMLASIYHTNKSEDVIKALIKPLKNRKVFFMTLLLLVLLSVWYYFN